jgi:very-short-patch-repair endonuclease
MLPTVYLVVTGEPSREQREVAALLYAGPRSVLTGASALRRHRLRERGGDFVDLLVPAACQRQSVEFVRLHRTARMPETHCFEVPFRWVLPPRAVADTALWMTNLADVRAVVAESIQRGRCSVGLLGEELRSAPIRGSALLRQGLAEIAEGVGSAAEGDLRDLIKKARLPMPLFNPRLFVDGRLIAVPDCWWPRAGVAAEVDSREWHFSPQDWEKTMRRHEKLSAHGIITLHFTPRRIREEPEAVVAAIRDALAAGEARPPLAIHISPAAA